MKHNKVSVLIGASTLAIIALVLIQVKWMQHSRDLIEEQFSHRVSLALCQAVSNLSETNACVGGSGTGCRAPGDKDDLTCGEQLTGLLQLGVFNAPLQQSLEFYGIELPYQTTIINKAYLTNDQLPPYTCSLCPMGTETHVLNIEFQGKMAYILKEMGLMLLLSILILIFICTVFFLASYHLIKQQRISTRNVEFFNSMAHEIRTPLANIKLAMKLLSKSEAQLKNNKYVQVVQRESKQLMKQVESVLHLAKLEDGEYLLNLEMVDVGELLSKVLSEMDLQIKEKEASISLLVNGPIPQIRADRFHLSNVFRNIIDNALKYARERPQVQIQLNQSTDGVAIHFQDNGVGISKNDQEVIFSKFQRISSGHLLQPKGFGLGLSYVKKIIELHRGAIQLSSEVDKGKPIRSAAASGSLRVWWNRC